MIARLLALLFAGLSLMQGGAGHLADQTSLGGNLYLVNKTYRLTEHYAPNDLVKPQVRSISGAVLMRAEAAGKLEALFAAAKEEGHTLVAVSGYRSYETQRLIYRRKVNSVGVKKADLLVAQPGTSEHQLGLAMDVGRKASANLNASFGRSKEGQWVRENAHRFGFIIRYKAEWTDITGYADEPWHLRYVGADHAAAVYTSNLPFEAYYEQLAQQTFGEFLANAAH